MSDFHNEVTQDQDDFELEIIDLPPTSKSHHMLANLTAFGSRFSSTRLSPRSSQKSSHTASEDDDFGVEITDLPGEINPPRAHIHWQNAGAGFSPRMRARQAFTVSSLLIVLAILLLGNFAPLRSHVFDLLTAATLKPTPSPSVPFSPGSAVHYGSGLIISGENVQVAVGNTAATHLDNVPACSQISLLQASKASALAGQLGQSPLWVTGFSGPVATLNHLTRSKQSLLGWYQEIKLILDTTYDGNVLIQGGAQDGGSLLWFGSSSDQMWTNTLMVNPRQPSMPGQLSKDGRHMMLTISLYVPQAGCYFLQADWAGGSWMGYFAAGK